MIYLEILKFSCVAVYVYVSLILFVFLFVALEDMHFIFNFDGSRQHDHGRC